MKINLILLSLFGVLSHTIILAQTIVIPMYLTDTQKTFVGNITATDTKYGAMFTPNLHSLTPSVTSGIHGFHLHLNPSCANNGMAAGSHFDPNKTNHHLGPYNSAGHLGDLPALYVNADGSVNIPVVAPRLKIKDLFGHSLMIHNGSDNYSDNPTLGGGESRMVCGVVAKN
jgi:Cu-Zn family superoxide dismutase